MMHEIGSEHFGHPNFQEAYEYGLDLWGDVLDPSKDGDRFNVLMAGAQCVKDDIEHLFGFSEGDAEIIMQRSFRDIAEARGLIGKIIGE